MPIGEDELQAYVDRRLSGERLALVEAHLAAHPDLGQQVAADRRLRDALRGQLEAKANEPVPARLRIANIRAGKRARLGGSLLRIAAVVAIFVAGAGSGWYAATLQNPASMRTASTATVAQGATAAYRTFVVEVAHPVEVDAKQEAHLVQWLSRRLGRPLVAPDLAKFGYRLMGGRLLPADSGQAAQFMYDDQSGKRITVYVRQAEGGNETAFRFQREGDTSSFAWIDQGFGFAVTGMAAREELLPIAEAVYRGFERVEEAPATRRN
ncbi:MAG: anti-sigma factor [Proteobacteria bacterium]|nr:anti-sigma factor [Pseudomonadota bacterium]